MKASFLRRANERKKSCVIERRRRKVKEFVMMLSYAEPVVILGNQKTGSTAIAALLAQATGRSITLDLQSAIDDVGWQLCVKYGVMSFENLAYEYKSDFCRSIIKEPSLTYFSQELFELLPKAKFVFIQRDPFQNIRSILNRLKIPGDLDTISYNDWPELCRTPVWRLTMDSSWLGRRKGSYIEGMAHRWDLSARTYLDAKEKFFLIKYEDFVKDKKKSVELLAAHLGLTIRNDISLSVDIQYQPKGYDNVPLSNSFGKKNMNIIRTICGESANALGYDL